MLRYGCAIQMPVKAKPPIPRPALLALHAIVADTRLTLVHGPAGYGKTSVLLDWRLQFDRDGRRSIWISARSGVTTSADLMGALAEALGLPDATVADLDTIAAHVADRASATRLIFFIDDVHLLDEAARKALVALTERARDLLAIVVASRGAQALPVARLRAHGMLLTVGPEQLRLSVREGLALLARDLRRPIDSTLGTDLIAATDGWVAGLGIVARAIEAGARDPLGEGGKRLFTDYFAEEVLAALPARQQRLLARIAIFGTIDAEVCRAVLDEHLAPADLAALVARDVFLFPAGAGAAVRLHPLMRAVLLDRLAADPPAARALHVRASDYRSRTGDPLAAVHHARAADDEAFLAEVLDRHAEELVYTAHMALVVSLGEALPWALLARCPALLLTIAWRKARQLAFETAERLIAAAEAAIDRLEADAIDEGRVLALRRLVRHRRIVLAASRDEMTLVEKGSEALLREIGDDNAYLTCNLLAMKMIARRELYHFQDAMRLEADTRIALARPGATFAAIAFKASIAPNLIAQGRCDTAERLLTEALDAAGSFGADPGLAALPALPLAELSYERGDLGRAASLHAAHIDHVREWGFADQILSGHLVGARLAMADGRVDDALALLHEAHLVALECGVPRMVTGVVAEQVRCLLLDGQVAAAERLAAEVGMLDGDANVQPSRASSRHEELRATTWIRLQTRRGRFANARRVARAWRDFLFRRGAIRATIGFELLLAQIAFLEGDTGEARRLLRTAISLAAPASFARAFVDEGEIIASLIHDAYRDDLRFGGPTDAFAMTLLDMVSPRIAIVRLEAEAATAEQLARRECEILALVDAGLRNREIGARLGLTEGTVKWYMQQIFDKLGVRRRPQAVIRARQLGMLR